MEAGGIASAIKLLHYCGLKIGQRRGLGNGLLRRRRTNFVYLGTTTFGKTPEHPSPHRSFFHRIFWLCQSRMGVDPINRILLGSKFTKTVHGLIRPHYLHAPNLAVLHWR
jgi:hypothetical protein